MTAWNIARAFRSSYNAMMEFRFARDAIAVRAIPGVVCGVFSVELYLKSLLVLEGRNVRKHEPSRLFQSLKPELRRHIAKHLRATEPEVLTVLGKLDGAFEGWRYVYEPGRSHQINHTELEVIFDSLERAILELHPDWPSGPA